MESKSTNFTQLDSILQSLVDFIRPETFIAPDELEHFHQLKEKILRDPSTKKSAVQSIRSTSAIYRFLGQHQKKKSAAPKKKSATPLSREDLLKKLHEKMPHYQQKQENGVDHRAKRKLSKEKTKEKPKKIRRTIEPSNSSTDVKVKSDDAAPTKSSISFGRFDFGPDGTTEKKKKTKKMKFESKEKQLKKTLKKIEEEENEIERLQEENPAEGEEIRRSKHWKSALAKAKGEKVRDNVQLLRKSIKKEHQRKERSAKKWKAKVKETKSRMKDRQKKRQENLEKRKDAKKAKIKKRLIKKGRLIS